MKTCTQCKVEKSLADFYTRSATGKVCSNCNSGIGFLQDNSTIIKEALKYVERTRK